MTRKDKKDKGTDPHYDSTPETPVDPISRDIKDSDTSDTLAEESKQHTHHENKHTIIVWCHGFKVLINLFMLRIFLLAKLIYSICSIITASASVFAVL